MNSQILVLPTKKEDMLVEILKTLKNGENKIWPVDFCDEDFCVGNKAPKAERGDLNSQDL